MSAIHNSLKELILLALRSFTPVFDSLPQSVPILLLLFQFLDPDIAEGHRTVFIFEADSAGAHTVRVLSDSLRSRLITSSPFSSTCSRSWWHVMIMRFHSPAGFDHVLLGAATSTTAPQSLLSRGPSFPWESRICVCMWLREDELRKNTPLLPFSATLNSKIQDEIVRRCFGPEKRLVVGEQAKPSGFRSQ